jgi:hypothetical protein
MQKLPAVEEAKALFEQAKDWGVWQWLSRKRQARQTADAAWEALEACEHKVIAGWGEPLRKAWGSRSAKSGNSDLHRTIQRLKQADEEANNARLAAEAQFDEADRRMSASMAREGSQMAIDAWAMREKLIRRMEALGRDS